MAGFFVRARAPWPLHIRTHAPASPADTADTMLPRATPPSTPHAGDDPADRIGYLPGMSQARPTKRSPIKTPPPRQAGESLRVLQDEFVDKNILLWFYAATAGVIAAGLVWAMMLVGYTMLETAWILTLAAAGNCIYAAFRFYKARHQLRAFRLGLEGERTVGALLEDLRRRGYRILHDIPNARKPTFNIDHVAIGPGGVFAIESKT